jgi:hypothetical protein
VALDATGRVHGPPENYNPTPGDGDSGLGAPCLGCTLLPGAAPQSRG